MGTIQAVLLAAVAGVGFAILYGLVFGCGYGLWQERTQAKRTWEGLLVTVDGIPVIQSSDAIGVKDYRLLTAGRFRRQKLAAGRSAGRGLKRWRLYGARSVAPSRATCCCCRRARCLLVFSFTRGNERGSCFAGYDTRMQFCVGYIGPGGFQITKPLESQQFSVTTDQQMASGTVSSVGHLEGYYDFFAAPDFADPLESTAFLHSAGRVYRVNFK